MTRRPLTRRLFTPSGHSEWSEAERGISSDDKRSLLRRDDETEWDDVKGLTDETMGLTDDATAINTRAYLVKG